MQPDDAVRQMKKMKLADEMLALLGEARLELRDLLDVVDGADGSPRPNRAMRLFVRIGDVMKEAGVES